MKEKTSRKPLILGLLVLIILAIAAAMFSSPQVTPQPVEEELKAENLQK